MPLYINVNYPNSFEGVFEMIFQIFIENPVLCKLSAM